MNAHRLIATTISTAAVAAAVVALVAPAQGQITQRIDEGASSSSAPVMDDCSLRAPCPAIAASSAGPAEAVQEATRPVVGDCSLRLPCAPRSEAATAQVAADDAPEQKLTVVVRRHTGLLR